MSNYTNYQSNQGFFPTESNNAYEATNFNSNDGYTYPLANDTVPFNASVPPPTTAAPMEDSSVLNNSSFSSFMGNFNLPLDIQVHFTLYLISSFCRLPPLDAVHFMNPINRVKTHKRSIQ